MFERGSKLEHLQTLQRAKKAGVERVWTGDIRRNRYLQENLQFALDQGIIDAHIDEDYSGQYSTYHLTWLKDPALMSVEDLEEFETS